MIMAENIKQQMVEIFSQAQMTSASHQKCAILLKKICDDADIETFFNCLEMILEEILLVDIKVKNPYVEKVSDFFALFCSYLKPKVSDNEMDDVIEHPCLSRIFDHLLEVQANQIVEVRFRACDLLNRILDALAGTEISTTLCDSIESNILERVHDPKLIIRMQALRVLYRLQDPSRQEDPIIRELVNFIEYDPSAKMRQLCLEKVAARRDVIPSIVKRIRDVDANVRLAAYKRLTNLADLLKIFEKRLIIKCGFLDSSEKVRDFMIKNLIPLWLEHYEGDYFKLMKAFRLDANEDDVKDTVHIYELVLSALFRQKPNREIMQVVPITEEKLIPFDKLNWESSSYWRIIVQYLRENDDLEENTSSILPELVHFCKYIKNFCLTYANDIAKVEHIELQFILQQMFLITKGYDLADTASRQSLNYLVSNILENFELSSTVIETIISNLESSIPNVENRTRFVSELISEIMYPMNSEECEKAELERTYQLSQMKVKLNCLVEDQRKAIINEDYLEAERLKHEIEKAQLIIRNLNDSTKENDNVIKRTDIPTIKKYLDITAALLLSPQIQHLTPALEALKNDVIQEVLIHENDTVRVKAMRCYSLCCIVDRNCAKMGIHLFSAPIFAYKAGEECDTETLLVCISAVVDMLRIYGSTLMAEPVDGDEISESQKEEHHRVFTGGTSLTELIQGLVDLMDDELIEVQEAAGRGLCSLILSERIHSPSVLSRLVLKWCSPASDELVGEKLKQMIGITLENIAKLPGSVEQLEGSVLITMKALVSAPDYSPLADVNIDSIAKFLLALCRTSVEGDHIHLNLGMSICCEMRKKPRNRMNFTYSKMLLLLDIPADKMAIRDLLVLCEDTIDSIRDRQTLQNVQKFMTQLKLKYKDVSTESENENINENVKMDEESEDSELDNEDTMRTV